MPPSEMYGRRHLAITTTAASRARRSLGVWFAAFVLLAFGIGGAVDVASVVHTADRAFAMERDVREAMRLNGALRTLHLDEVTGIRGYTSTGDGAFLQPYRAARAEFPGTARRLRDAVAAIGLPTEGVTALVASNTRWLTGVAQPLSEHPHALLLHHRLGERENQTFRGINRVLDAALDAKAAKQDAAARELLRRTIVITFSVIGLFVMVLVGGLLRDIRSLRRSDRQLRRLAEIDALTGLPNRRVMDAHLDDAIERAERDGVRFGIGFVDLNDFKPVNDRLGHGAGDALLIEVAHRLRDAVRPQDLVGRIGGDEFLIVLNAIDDRAEATAIGARLRATLAGIAAVDGTVLPISASVGVALFPDDADDARALVRAADLAMYEAKEASRASESPGVVVRFTSRRSA